MRLMLTIGMGSLLAALFFLHDGPGGPASAQSRTWAGTAHTGDVFRFNKVREGLYHAIGTGTLSVVGNSSVIVNDDHVIVVDDHTSPAAAAVLLDEIKRLTDKPVRYVINTHFHYDHAHGNQVFGPSVRIIGHEFTRYMLSDRRSVSMPLYQAYVGGMPKAIDDLKARAASATDPAEKARLQAQAAITENNLASQKELQPVAPDITLTSEMTLFSGTREIQIRHLGRAHTAGDVVVYLPREKVVLTGDMLTAALSNLSDAYPDEWVTTLDNLKKLDFDTVMPGHGEAFTDKAKIDYFQAWLRDAWTEVERLKAQGLSAEAAAPRVDLTRHKEHFPTIQPGLPLIGVQRIYALLDERAGRR